MILIVNFGLKIKELRMTRNLTKKQLADMIGVSTSTIYSYESGNRYPSYGVLISLARIFHVSTDYLLGLERTKTIDVSNLNDREINIILQMVDLLQDKKYPRKKGGPR